MTAETLFSKIIRKEIPADIVFQDERVTAFRDINPQAPCHILVIPNKAIATVNDISLEDQADIGYMLVVAKNIAIEEGIAEDGYRLIINCGKNGHQEVFHLHMHLLGGRPMGRMVQRPAT